MEWSTLQKSVRKIQTKRSSKKCASAVNDVPRRLEKQGDEAHATYKYGAKQEKEGKEKERCKSAAKPSRL